MTTVITRFFDDASDARAAKFELRNRQGISSSIMRTFTSADGLVDKLTDAKVDRGTAEAYASRMANGGTVLVVWAGFKPLGVAQIVRDVTADMGAADMGGLEEEVFVKDTRDPTLRVMQDHPHIMTRRPDPDIPNYRMADWPIPLISRRKPSSHSIFPPHQRMASEPIPLLYEAAVGERYKPFTKSIFGRHARMANWPIGLLAPDNVRYGRFPFGLLVPGKNYMAKFPFGHIVPGHKHYAKFPIDHLVPGHKYMANWIWPHTKTKAS